jgi:hypothetical protein
VGEPGTHGDEVAGIQGIGVSTPDAAEVADATMGLASELQTPDGKIFVNGMLSTTLSTCDIFHGP